MYDYIISMIIRLVRVLKNIVNKMDKKQISKYVTRPPIMTNIH